MILFTDVSKKYKKNIIPIIVLKKFPPTNEATSKMSVPTNFLNKKQIIIVNIIAKILINIELLVIILLMMIMS